MDAVNPPAETPKNKGGRPHGTTRIEMAFRIDRALGNAIEALDQLHGEHLAAFAKAVGARVKADRVALSILKATAHV